MGTDPGHGAPTASDRTTEGAPVTTENGPETDGEEPLRPSPPTPGPPLHHVPGRTWDAPGVTER